MLSNIIQGSLKNKFFVFIGVLALIAWGIFSFTRLPIDAIPDITNNQAQVLTVCPSLATQEVERFVTAPIEYALKTVPGVIELRSISRFGLSVVTVVFEESADIYRARQLTVEKLREAERNIPSGFGIPELAPISTGLGEILHYRIEPKPGYENRYSAADLRTMQDWIVRKQLLGIPGVVEVNSFGGYLKQYEVAVTPERLRAFGIGLQDLMLALENANENAGGAYIEKAPNAYFIRSEGLIKTIDDIRHIVVGNRNGVPILVGDLADVRLGHALRYGAVSHNGEGEIVLGIVMMLKGENAASVIQRVKERLSSVQESLPEGITITTFLDREKLVARTIHTVQNNLIEGALFVIFVLVLLVGNLRAGLIIASVIPLSMLFAVGMMQVFGVTANLMSLGAVDFGLVVDGAVIIVEAALHYLHTRFKPLQAGTARRLVQSEMDDSIHQSARRVMRSSVFGVVIILIVYLPILSLTGVEGKMFKPMAQTVSFALIGALILSLTYVPAVSAIFLQKNISAKRTFADRLIIWIEALYLPLLRAALQWRKAVLAITLGLLLLSLGLFSRLGGEFIPTLDEGDIMMHGFLRPGASLSQTLESHRLVQKILLDSFPDEVEQVISKIGSAEIPTDPMAIETADNVILLQQKSNWTKAETKEELVEQMEKTVQAVPGMAFEFTQPIKMRFDEMMTGVRADVAVKIFGENLDSLLRAGHRLEKLIHQIAGIQDLKVEQIEGLPQINIRYNYEKIARYGLRLHDLNESVRAAFAGAVVGVVLEDEKRFDLVVRLDTTRRRGPEDVRNLPILLPSGQMIPLSEAAEVDYLPGAAQISRDDGQRRIVVTANVRGRDVESVIRDVQNIVKAQLSLPPGYTVTYGGQFENLQAAKSRLSLAVPVALALIFLLLYLAFNTVWEALLIFTAIPLSAVGGVLALVLRGMPFSISAGVGFIALFGVAVLNGIVLIAYFKQLEQEGERDVYKRIIKGAKVRLRPVLMTAAVASLGFVPMAISHGAGAEVQRPLATVVIGGLLSSTLLTLLVLPVLYAMIAKINRVKMPATMLLSGILLLALPTASAGQTILSEQQAIQWIVEKHPSMRAGALKIRQQTLLSKARPAWSPADLYHNITADPDLGVFGTTALGINQAFPNGRLRRAQQHYHAREADVAAAEQAFNRHLLIKEVRSLYQHLSYLDQKQVLYKRLDSLYSVFARTADARHRQGESSLLEKRAADDKAAQIRLALQTIGHETGFDRQVLGQLLGLGEPVIPLVDTFRAADFSLADTLRLSIAPLAELYRYRIDAAQAQTGIEQARLRPSAVAGLNMQYLANGLVFPGYQVGLSIPLVQKGLRQRIEATALNAEIARADRQQIVQEQQMQLSHYLHEIEKFESLLQYYHEGGKAVARELWRNALANYQAGEIGYAGFLQYADQALQIELDYIQHLYEYNLTIIEIKALLGE